MPRTLAKSAGHLWRFYARKPMAERAEMSGRHVIVTGASPQSIGYETERILASWGAHVVAIGLRDTHRTERGLKSELRGMGADGSDLNIRALDLCGAGSVGGFAAWSQRRHGRRLYALINKAGIHKNIFLSRQMPPLSADGFEIRRRTNCLGGFHLTSLLLPCLQQTRLEDGNARVINVSPHLHNRVKNADGFRGALKNHSLDAYTLAKLALIHFSIEFNRRFARQFGLESVALHPGSVHTKPTGIAPVNGRPALALRRASSAMESLVLLHHKYEAQTAEMCASKASIKGGGFYERCRIAESSVECKEGGVSRRLWDRTEGWVKGLEASRKA